MQVGRKTAPTYTSRDLAGKSITNITKPRQPKHVQLLLDVFEVCNTSGELVSVWIQELNNMYPQKYGKGTTSADRINNTYGSSIAEHLINNCNCALSYSADLFTILSKSHSDHHLKVLETIHILTHKPSLCKQRKCLLGLNLITI